MKPQISIVTPSFNQGKYIERTILSVLSQNVRGLEYLVIDGGSTDSTISILERYGDRFYWISEKDNGHSDAINKGILHSKGRIIGWLNSDDIYYPNALQEVLDFFSRTDADVVYGDANHIDEYDNFLEKYPTEDWNWERLLEVCYISQPATFLRRNVLDKYGLLDIRLGQSMDYEYWIRLGKNGVRFVHLKRVLSATRIHSEAFTVRSKVACHRNINDFMQRHFGRVPDSWIFNYAHAVVESKGYRRDRRVVFALAVSLASLLAAIQWNRVPSWNIVKTTARWIVGNVWRFMVRRLVK